MRDLNKKAILFLLAALNFTHILDFMIMMPLGNYLMPYFRISPQKFSLLVGAYTLSAAVSGFGAAFFVDRFDRKRVLLIGYGGFLIGTLVLRTGTQLLYFIIRQDCSGFIWRIDWRTGIVDYLGSFYLRGKGKGNGIGDVGLRCRVNPWRSICAIPG